MTSLASFWCAGFESACHRLRDGRRLDLVAATRHDRFAAADYRRLRAYGLNTARDGVSWPRAVRDGRLDLSPLLARVRAARSAGIQVIWDLCHYGWPDGVDLWKPGFLRGFAAYARAVARLIAGETEEPPIYTPINEISFWAWAGGEVGYLNPFGQGRGRELKMQLVRATVEAIHALREVDPRARILHSEPLIHVASEGDASARTAAEECRRGQFEALDAVAGRIWPHLGGDERCLDLVGLNFYPGNQWLLDGRKLSVGEPLYRPLRDLLAEVSARYRRPLVLAETGAEGEARPGWLAYVGAEVRAAMRQGVPIEGICLYPILDYPGWDDDRHCPAGLWGMADERGERVVYEPLARELADQQSLFTTVGTPARASSPLHQPDDPTTRGVHLIEPGNLSLSATPTRLPDLVAFSQLRWDFVTQRPQHLMTRCARERRVFFVEEPEWVGEEELPWLATSRRPEGVVVVVPRLPHRLASDRGAADRAVNRLLTELFGQYGSASPILWFWTPMALPWAHGIEAAAVVYDCMDELSLFVGAPPELCDREEQLLKRADLVFTGGRSLFEAKGRRHSSVHLFPSSIDAAHFGRARYLDAAPEPADQAAIACPRLGYFGVIDERFDRDLVAGLAAARPEWQLILLGPVVKIDPTTLPRADNIYFLGSKSYQDLPAYLAGWDVALLPFAANESTRFISPTKTPEYLAGGCRVVSTPIRDVVEPYGRLGLIEVAEGVDETVAAVERCLADRDRKVWLEKVDEQLAGMSWDRTWREMSALLGAAVEVEQPSLAIN